MGYKLGEQMKQSMNWNSYLDARLQFETDVKSTVPERVSNNTDLLRGLHFVMGMVTETHELKDHTDRLNLIEEVGDALWFFGGLLDMLQGRDNAVLMHFVVAMNAQYLEAVKDTAEEYVWGEKQPHYGIDFAVTLLDMYKAAIFYGRTLDPAAMFNLIESFFHELIFDFMASNLAHFWDRDDELKPLSIEAIMAVNIAKLSARYSEGYADAKANNRNKEFEREAMQKALEPYL
jgi:hypothetical protein